MTRLTGVRVRAEDWDLARVPMHLLPRYRVVDESGTGARARAATWPPCSAGTHLTAPRCSPGRPTTSRSPGPRRGPSGPSPRPSSGSSPGSRSRGTPRWSTGADRSTSRCWPTQARRSATHLRGVRRLVALAVPNPAPRGHASLDMTGRLILGRYPHGGAQALLDDCADACIDALLTGPPVRDAQSFADAVSRITLELPRATRASSRRWSRPWAWPGMRERSVDALHRAVVADSVADVRAELDRLVGPRPVTRIGADQLPDLRRYLQALAWRACEVGGRPGGRRPPAGGGPGGGTDDGSVRSRGGRCTIRWPADDTARAARRMIDEYRVSLFAQHIRTAVPVSERRIEKFVAGDQIRNGSLSSFLIDRPVGTRELAAGLGHRRGVRGPGAGDRALVGQPIVGGCRLEVQPRVEALGLGRGLLEVGDQLRALVGGVGLERVAARLQGQLEGVAGDCWSRPGRPSAPRRWSASRWLTRYSARASSMVALRLAWAACLRGPVLLDHGGRAAVIGPPGQTPLCLRLGQLQGCGQLRPRCCQARRALCPRGLDLRGVRRASRAQPWLRRSILGRLLQGDDVRIAWIERPDRRTPERRTHPSAGQPRPRS